jgi:hypothetical protein
MSGLLVGGQILVLAAMVAVSLWGRKNLDEEARIRARVGLTGIDYTMKKRTSLIYTPAIGSVVVIGTLAVMGSTNADTIAALGLGILVMLLWAHWWAIRRAAR